MDLKDLLVMTKTVLKAPLETMKTAPKVAMKALLVMTKTVLKDPLAMTKMALKEVTMKMDLKDLLVMMKTVLKDRPNWAEGYIALGDILRREKKYTEAAAAYDSAIKLTPDRPDSWAIYYARGTALERTKSWDLAEKDFRKALQLKPDAKRYIRNNNIVALVIFGVVLACMVLMRFGM